MDEQSPNDPDETFDPTHRKLCPDGACVGVIGADGVCGECGRTEAQAAAGEAAPDAFGPLDDDAERVEGAEGASGFDSKRRLCDDGSCVGVVGPDGVCAVCGRRSE